MESRHSFSPVHAFFCPWQKEVDRVPVLNVNETLTWLSSERLLQFLIGHCEGLGCGICAEDQIFFFFLNGKFKVHPAVERRARRNPVPPSLDSAQCLSSPAPSPPWPPPPSTWVVWKQIQVCVICTHLSMCVCSVRTQNNNTILTPGKLLSPSYDPTPSALKFKMRMTLFVTFRLQIRPSSCN